MIGYGLPISGFAGGDLHDNGNGTVSVKKPNGKYLCVTPEGEVQERDEPGGPWESFRKGKGCLIAERESGIAISNVMVMTAGGVATRVGYRVEGGRSVRVAKKGGETLDKK